MINTHKSLFNQSGNIVSTNGTRSTALSASGKLIHAKFNFLLGEIAMMRRPVANYVV